MSTIRLTKDSEHGRKNALVSKPFGAARDLIAAGLAELAQGSPPAAAPRADSSEAARHASEILRLNALHTTNLREVREEAEGLLKDQAKRHEAEKAKLEADLEAANKTIAELNAKAAKK